MVKLKGGVVLTMHLIADRLGIYLTRDGRLALVTYVHRDSFVEGRIGDEIHAWWIDGSWLYDHRPHKNNLIHYLGPAPSKGEV